MSAALTSEAVARNRDPILAVLRRVLPRTGTVLEIASGTGGHALYFAGAFPSLAWQPTDVDTTALASIAAYRETALLSNLHPPLALDVTAAEWPLQRADAMVAINMIHIAPWSATEGLLAGARRILPPGGILYLYGPYKEADVPTSPSNVAFDASLRARDPRWGLRDLTQVLGLAAAHQLELVERVAMPANNLSVVLRRRSSG
ncbi:MAG: DUF938 domain-containing protein [Hyphomicrobiales bacterium]|nr:DUF938 domain-containing protein [Hyphomicrobiales bacterium]